MANIPMSLEEAKQRGWNSLDVILISGDAFVDHSAFGIAVIARVLEKNGFSVGIIAQPDWHKLEDFKKLGKPNLFFGITAGNLDSKVANYTPLKKPRDKDDYSPASRIGLRPDLASVVYSHKVKEAYKGVPIILGGVEATVRRFAHFDFVDNKVRRSVLFDAKADLIAHGMGEKTIVEIAHALKQRKTIEDLKELKGISYNSREKPENTIEMPSFEEVSAESFEGKKKFNEAFRLIYFNSDPFSGRILAQKHADRYLISNPNVLPFTEKELDEIYELPYTRKAHPSYKEEIPALKTVEFSIQIHRGCFGSCSFCVLPLIQGRTIQSRSIASIKKEVEEIKKMKNFKGIINDLSGPSANMYGLGCKGKLCYNNCLSPNACGNLEVEGKKLIELYKEIKKMPGIKRVFIRSGIRLDLALHQPEYLDELFKYHISGQLKIAPEHISEKVTRLMNKSNKKELLQFLEEFAELNKKYHKEYYVIPYFISAHPGCSLNEMAELVDFMIQHKMFIKQTQLFTPTPMTASTAMYYAEMDPFTNEKIYVAKTYTEKKLQNALLHFMDYGFEDKADIALKQIKRQDLLTKIQKIKEGLKSKKK
ncbi:MAG: YgiQ family radical SAM protein [Candidatus Diapherotrites archaeon CG08_land_8_20_14_0_20_34_12]|nr:MAG: YgiQ family radical SAM protein [Candidatus Diapherotrites archaeon CG08_land_8_20_14_0_20_34_12]